MILVRPETTADDIHGLIHADGVLTARGGMTSHAAVVARGLGKPFVAGCAALQIDLESRVADVAGQVVHEGDLITIDGTTGDVMIGSVALVQPGPNADLDRVLGVGRRVACSTPRECGYARGCFPRAGQRR